MVYHVLKFVKQIWIIFVVAIGLFDFCQYSSNEKIFQQILQTDSLKIPPQFTSVIFRSEAHLQCSHCYGYGFACSLTAKCYLLHLYYTAIAMHAFVSVAKLVKFNMHNTRGGDKGFRMRYCMRS